MIDYDSPAGAYAVTLLHSPCLRVEEYDSFAAKLERNLAIRRANRPRKSQIAIKGWETRNESARAIRATDCQRWTELRGGHGEGALS